jgi:hypothetical protein
LLVQSLGPVVESVLNWVKVNRQLIGLRIQQFVRGLVSVGLVLWRVFSSLVEVAQGVVKWWKLIAIVAGSVLLASIVGITAAMIAQAGGFMAAAGSLAIYVATSIAGAAMTAAAWWAANAPFVALAAVLAFVVLAAEDVYGYFTGADSVLGSLGPRWTKFLDDFSKDAPSDPPWLRAIKMLVFYLTDIEARAPALWFLLQQNPFVWLFKAWQWLSEIPEKLSAAGDAIQAALERTRRFTSQFDVQGAVRDMAVPRGAPAWMSAPATVPFTPSSSSTANFSAGPTSTNVTVNVKSVDEVKPAVSGAISGAAPKLSSDYSDAASFAGFGR